MAAVASRWRGTGRALDRLLYGRRTQKSTVRCPDPDDHWLRKMPEHAKPWRYLPSASCRPGIRLARPEVFPVQTEEPNLVIGGLLSMISPVSDTVK